LSGSVVARAQGQSQSQHLAEQKPAEAQPSACTPAAGCNVFQVKRTDFQGIRTSLTEVTSIRLLERTTARAWGYETNKGAYGTARVWTRKTPTQNGCKRGDRPFASAAAQKVHRIGVCRPTPGGGSVGDSRPSSGMDLHASIVIFAIPAIFRRH